MGNLFSRCESCMCTLQTSLLILILAPLQVQVGVSGVRSRGSQSYKPLLGDGREAVGDLLHYLDSAYLLALSHLTSLSLPLPIQLSKIGRRSTLVLHFPR